MDIRKATTRDANNIVKVIEKTVLETHKHLYSPENIKYILNNYSLERVLHFIDSYNYFIAEENGQVIGCVLFKEGKIRSLYVLPLFEGKGLGRKLLEIAEDCAKENGYKEIWLWSSLVSYDFYIHMGYEFLEDVNNENGIVIDKAMKKTL